LTYAQKLCCGGLGDVRDVLLRCKNGSARKCLILLSFALCTVSVRRPQLVDLSGRAGRQRGSINKVIHTHARELGKALWNQVLIRVSVKMA
jgi:hypothetical protein